MDTVAAVFPLEGPVPPVPDQTAGAAAEAIRHAETALARQNSVTANVDLQVVTAVLNARAAHAGGEASLRALQQEIEAAIATRTDLDTPTGAREFQRYLIDKLHDIRAVVEEADLDDTSKAALAAALASLYATSGSADTPAGSSAPAVTAAPSGPPPIGDPAPPTPRPETAAPAAPVDLGLDAGLGPGFDPGFDPGLDGGSGDDAGPPPPAPIGAPPTALPSFGGAPAPALPSLGGLSPLAPLSSLAGLAAQREGDEPDGTGEPDPPVDDAGDPTEDPQPAAAEGAPDRPAVAGIIAAAVAGTPIDDAFGQQGITIPAPGSPVSAPLDPGELVAGDVGIFSDRHALALGNGKALLDNQIQPIETVNRPGFIGWQHPPAPPSTASDSDTAQPPAPLPPAPPVAPAD